jgi:hypothetical protein
MTTVIPFIPSNIQAPAFPLILDGKSCNAIITWNISALRYYVNIYDSNGNWIITTALVSTPPARNVQNAVYDPFLNSIVVQLVDPSFWPIPAYGPVTPPGQMVDYTMENFQPTTYNGKFRCMHIDAMTFTFPMITDPGPLVILGRVSRLLNMVESVMQTSTMVYRNGAFEINP